MAEAPTITLTGTTPSAELSLVGKTITRIYMPGTWDASNIQFLEAYESGGTFRPLYDDAGDRVTIAAGADRMIAVDPRRFQAARYVKLVATNSQGGARTLRVQLTRLTDLVYTQGGNAGVAL
jgi:hypothetical protein